MKRTLVLSAILSLSVTPLWAQDGAALYKTKCANCHGDQGQGKPKLGSKLAAISKSQTDIVTVLTKGGGQKAPHVKPMAGLTEDQAKTVAAFVKTLK